MHPFTLGTHRRPIATASPEAQRRFDQGLNWCFGFNQVGWNAPSVFHL